MFLKSTQFLKPINIDKAIFKSHKAIQLHYTETINNDLALNIF